MQSRLYLAKLDPQPATILDHLVERFPHVPRDEWLERFERGLVRTAGGRRLTARSPYAHGLTITYEREVHDEPRVPYEIAIAYRDERIIVVDKPPFLPVVPGGRFVEECVLARLRALTGLDEVTPVHRLDRDTSGLVLFVIEQSMRAQYHRLFATGDIEREYRATALVPIEPAEREWMVSNRIASGEPWYRMRIVEGEPNATTTITLDRWSDGRGEFHLVPRTGRKHQLRLHMVSLGWPIENDPYYPEVTPRAEDDFTRPMQLRATRIAFTDPVSGERIEVKLPPVAGSRLHREP